MAFAIMRCSKLKSAGNIGAALEHCFRERETPNADSELTSNNIHYYAANKTDALRLMRQRLPEKRRKDAVLLIEYMMTASPEFWKNADDFKKERFFKLSLNWLKNKYGEKNIIVATVHNDETSPHLSVFVVPVTQDGRLSAKDFIGNKTQMSADQTGYWQKVAGLGLQRGIEGSRAKHTTIRQFYTQMQKTVGNLDKMPQIETAKPYPPEIFRRRVVGFEEKTEKTGGFWKREEKIRVEVRETEQERAIRVQQTLAGDFRKQNAFLREKSAATGIFRTENEKLRRQIGELAAENTALRANAAENAQNLQNLPDAVRVYTQKAGKLAPKARQQLEIYEKLSTILIGKLPQKQQGQALLAFYTNAAAYMHGTEFNAPKPNTQEKHRETQENARTTAYRDRSREDDGYCR